MSIRKQSISGVKWTSLSTITSSLTSILKISILARFLDKSDFGLMALVVFIIGFTNLFMDMGLTSAILNKQEISKNEYSSLYWLNLLFSILLVIILIASSSFVSEFYNEPDLKNLIPLMSINVFLAGIGRQFKTIEQKHLNFKFIAKVDVAAAILSLAFAIILAVQDFGVYALVYSSILLQLISNLSFFSQGIRRIKLKRHFQFNETKPFLKIGIYQVGGQVVNYFNRDLDILVIGKLMGSDVLGGYNLAKQLARRPLRIINPIVLKVYSAILPKYQKDQGKLRKYFGALLQNLCITNAFIYGLMAVMAPTLVKIFYGNGFSDIEPILVGFCAIIYLRSSSLVGVFGITTGRTDLEMYWNLLNVPLFPVAILLGSYYSVYHIVYFLAIVQLVLIYPCYLMFYKKLINFKLTTYLKHILIPLVICSVVFSLAWYIDSLMSDQVASILVQVGFSFILAVFLGSFAYFYSPEFTNVLLKRKVSETA